MRIAAGLALSWLAINAAWGLWSPEGTAVARALSDVGALEVWLASCITASAGLAIVPTHRPDRLTRGVLWTLTAFQVGVVLEQLALEVFQPSNPLAERAFMVVAALPIALAWGATGRREWTSLLRWGDWEHETALVSTGRRRPWSRWLILSVVFVGLPLLLLFQGAVGFEPILSGRVLTAIPLIFGLALLNGAIEEFLFRGLLMPPLIAALGRNRGIWAQAGLFGFLHWGASPDLISGMPTALILVLLGALMGKSAHETQGLGWAIILHAVLDVSVLSVVLTNV